MAASQTVPHLPQSYNLLVPKHGVVTLFGYGISVNVDRGHLILKDGIGTDRQEGRFGRVRHGLRRLVIIGSDGFVSLAALRWLADQDASFVMLDRDGSVLATTGPVRGSDSRLRRAQALAHQSEKAVGIARELIAQKLTGQERLAREILRDAPCANLIASARVALAETETIAAVRLLEAQAAQAYWSLWRTLPVNFPKKDLRRVPEHWRTFGTRKSPLSGSPRLAVNPPNAMLNYLYALLESESRLGAAALGLDPGIGFLHVDTDARDSLACDLMEAVRPQVDGYVLDWIMRESLRREWFFEQRDGNCRLMGSFAVRLSETALAWGRAVAPVAEWVSRTLWSARHRPARQTLPATRLTQAHRRQASNPSLPTQAPPRPPTVCRDCGAQVSPDQRYCSSCAVTVRTTALAEAARIGRTAAQSREAQARRADTQRLHQAARRKWQAHGKSDGLDEKAYVERIQPRLMEITVAVIASALRVSEPYASDIRTGRRVPHPRHWQVLVRLVGGLSDGQSRVNANRVHGVHRVHPRLRRGT
jgi:CRISPR-associated endonuclease Cas1